MKTSFDQVEDVLLPEVAERFVEAHCCDRALRYKIEELMWAHAAGPRIPTRFRRELAQALAPEDLFLKARAFEDLLETFWIIDDDPFASFLSDKPTGLRAEIQRHVIRNPEDWSVDELFDRLGAYRCTDRRFALFIEGLASSEVRPNGEDQYRFAALINEALRPTAVGLEEYGTVEGYPVFRMIALGKHVSGRPKNLIFACSVKPDLRFRDAVNNDIQIVSNSDRVLVYEEPISVDGLSWKDLQDWWARRENLEADSAKRTLYRRLVASLPQESPPQRLLFHSYFKRFGPLSPDRLPALLPEVWLHWDPKTARERGPAALTRFRMDFLMLLPHNVRIVIEVDGKHHYALNDGLASPKAYAAMAADRDLRLSGYDVYRFGPRN
jgi:hypothetical protein